MKSIVYLFIIILFYGSCTEEYNIKFENNDPKLVVEGIITNQPGPYFVKLSLSKSSFLDQSHNDTIEATYLFNGFKPVTEALVIISDNKGITDTLINSPDSIYHVFIRGIDTKDSARMLNPKGHFLGYYQTTKIIGKPGNTYFLKIIYKSKEYTSVSLMPLCPTIDSVQYSMTKGDVGKSDYLIPRIWFKDDPKESNYYLFNTIGGGGVWSRSILSDANIKSNIIGLDVFKGESPDYWMNGYPTPGGYYKIEMSSVTKEIYEYYRVLIVQFRNDGGVYTPSPASPTSNIDGGLGYFRASSVQTIEEILPFNE